MTRRDQIIECVDALEEGMERVAGGDIWQNRVIWWLCKAVVLLLRKELR